MSDKKQLSFFNLQALKATFQSKITLIKNGSIFLFNRISTTASNFKSFFIPVKTSLNRETVSPTSTAIEKAISDQTTLKERLSKIPPIPSQSKVFEEMEINLTIQLRDSQQRYQLLDEENGDLQRRNKDLENKLSELTDKNAELQQLINSQNNHKTSNFQEGKQKSKEINSVDLLNLLEKDKVEDLKATLNKTQNRNDQLLEKISTQDQNLKTAQIKLFQLNKIIKSS